MTYISKDCVAPGAKTARGQPVTFHDVWADSEAELDRLIDSHNSKDLIRERFGRAGKTSTVYRVTARVKKDLLRLARQLGLEVTEA